MNNIIEQAKALRAGMRVSARFLDDATAISQPSAFYDEWMVGTEYERNDKVIYKGILYNIEQPKITSIESQTPDMPGMLAVYRPIVEGHAGTLEDPINFVYGMDCHLNKYYIYKNKVYLCKGDMIPCVWAPDTGIWQWEVIK